jgi:hypothetical protein
MAESVSPTRLLSRISASKLRSSGSSGREPAEVAEVVHGALGFVIPESSLKHWRETHGNRVKRLSSDRSPQNGGGGGGLNTGVGGGGGGSNVDSSSASSDVAVDDSSDDLGGMRTMIRNYDAGPRAAAYSALAWTGAELVTCLSTNLICHFLCEPAIVFNNLICGLLQNLQ